MPVKSVFFEQTIHVYFIMASLILILVRVPDPQMSTSDEDFEANVPSLCVQAKALTITS